MTDTAILSQNSPKRQPGRGGNRRGRRGAIYDDPVRHLLAAVALTAVKDILYPPANLSDYDRYTARKFIQEHEDTLLALDIPPHKIKALAGEER